VTTQTLQREYGGGLTFRDATYEVWHQDDRGDLCLACFDVELPAGYDRWYYVDDSGALQFTAFGVKEMVAWLNGPVKAEFERAVINWDAMKLREDDEVRTSDPTVRLDKQTGLPAIHFCPLPDMQDYRRFFFVARFKKQHAQRMPLDMIAMFAEQGEPDTPEMMRNFFEQMDGFKEGRVDAADLESQAQDSKTLKKRADEEQKAQERIDYLLTHRISR